MLAFQQKLGKTKTAKGKMAGRIDGRSVYFDKGDAGSPALVEAFAHSVTGGDPYDWCLRNGFLKESKMPDWMERLINEVHSKWASGNNSASEI